MIPDHPDIAAAMSTGYPAWGQPKSHYCDKCGRNLDDETIYEDDDYEYLCEYCLESLHEKRW